MSERGQFKLSLSLRFWRIVGAMFNLLRLVLSSPRLLWTRAPNPWERLTDARQFDALLQKYPEQPIGKNGIMIGVLKDFGGKHVKYLAACRELDVEHRLVDFLGDDWLQQVKASGCDGFIVHPTAYHQPWRNLFEERTRIISCDLGLPVHPGSPEIWFYESKRRMAYWLQAHEVSHPVTHVFHDRDDAFRFAEKSSYPLIVKMDSGSSASGVFKVHSRREAGRLIAQAFSGGLSGSGRDPREREWGFILFQEYLAHPREYRVIQVGSSWFAHEKIAHAETGFHSGSGTSAWNIPPLDVFDFCREVSIRGGFRAMNYDVFFTGDGRILINELQSVFAAYNPSQMYRDGIPGRFVHDGKTWQFEEGLFCRNGCANLRVRDLVEEIADRKRDGKSAIGPNFG